MDNEAIDCIDIALIVDNKPVRLELNRLDGMGKLDFTHNGIGTGLNKEYLDELERIHKIMKSVIDFNVTLCELWMDCPLSDSDKIVIVTKDKDIKLNDFVNLHLLNKINNSDKLPDKLKFCRTVHGKEHDWKSTVLYIDMEDKIIRFNIR